MTSGDFWGHPRGGCSLGGSPTCRYRVPAGPTIPPGSFCPERGREIRRESGVPRGRAEGRQGLPPHETDFLTLFVYSVREKRSRVMPGKWFFLKPRFHWAFCVFR